jgi:DNA-binding NarL/FixJ family response regulator
MSAIVLFITDDRDLMKRLGHSVAGFDKDALTIVCVDRLSGAIQRLSLNDSIDAVILDWGLPATEGFEALLVLIRAAPHLPIIVLGDDVSLPRQMDLVERGAQDYLLRRRADTDTLICMVHSAIARKSREGIFVCDKERAEAALNSIGDVAASTGGKSRITILNPVSKRPVGGSNAAATRRKFSSPTLRAVK